MHPVLILCFTLIALALVLWVWSETTAKEILEENWKTKVANILMAIGLIILVFYFGFDILGFIARVFSFILDFFWIL